MRLAIRSSASARALIFSPSSSAGTVIRLRTLPLIWITIVISSSEATAGSNAGQAASAKLSVPAEERPELFGDVGNEGGEEQDDGLDRLPDDGKPEPVVRLRAR